MDYMLHKYTGDSQRKPAGHSGLHQFQSSSVLEIHTSLVRGAVSLQDMQMLNFISIFILYILLATKITPTVKFNQASAEVIILLHEDLLVGSGKSMGEKVLRKKLL